jgi:hypothetical protein
MSPIAAFINMLHLILYEVSHCDFHHIDGVCSWYLWSFWMDLGGYIFMEPLLFLALDYLMEIFGGGDSLLYGGWSWLMVILWFGATFMPLLDGSLS